MKLIQLESTLRLFHNGNKWALEQKQAIAGRATWNLAATTARPQAASDLGLIDRINAAIVANAGDDVRPSDHETIAALL